MFPSTGLDAVQNRNLLLLLGFEPQSIGRQAAAPRDYKSQKKGNVHPITCPVDTGEAEIHSCTLPLTSALDGGGWLTRRSVRFATENYPVATV